MYQQWIGMTIIFAPISALNDDVLYPRGEVGGVGGCVNVNGLDSCWGWCDGARRDGRATSV
eukprot:scaffold1497_cov244-Skeletonema_menzelii.AAC.1